MRRNSFPLATWWPLALVLLVAAGCDGRDPAAPTVTDGPLFHPAGEEPPPPVGEEGCTPGFWMNNTAAWAPTGYSPDTPFSAVFADAFPGMTLHQVISQGGGDWNALGRQTVAALLNAAHPDVAYPLTAQQVIDEFNHTWNVTRDWEGQKDRFEQFNEQGCPLQADPATS